MNSRQRRPHFRLITGASEHQLDTAELTEAAEAVRRVEFARKIAQPTAQDQESFAKQ